MKLELEIMERFLSLCSHVLIMLVHVQISVALFLNECPEKLMWNLRAEQLCGVADKYMCLYDTNKRKFRELCKNGPEFHRPGNIFVISGNLQYFAGRQCYGNRYQPHKWWTNGSSECQYIKSSCNGEGQVPYDNGTITSDRKCRCDYTNYYTLVSSTKKKCYCDPIEEDCSCYRQSCNEDQVLTPDYDCVGVHEWTGQYDCPEYKEPRITDNKKMQQTTICPNIKKDLSGTIQQSSARVAVSVTSGVFMILALEAADKLKKELETKVKDDLQNFKTHLLQDFFLEDPSNVECKEGEDAILNCKVLSMSPPITWLKDGRKIMENETYSIINEDTQRLLIIRNTTASDSGEYYVTVGKNSRKLHLSVTAYFVKDPVDVACTEGDDAIFTCTVCSDSPLVKWMKNGKVITENEKYKITSDCTQHELKLNNTNRDDGGDYSVNVGKSFRKVGLTVEVVFLRDPHDSECKEGDDAVFTFKLRCISSPIQLLKNGRNLIENENVEMTIEDSVHTIKLINTKTSDKGKYFVCVGKVYRTARLDVKEIASIDEKRDYMKAIKSGKEVRKYVRLHVIGKDGVGKTSLVRRLLGKQIDGTISTDGIDINKTCQIRTSDGEWILGEVETEMEKIGRRILQAVNMKVEGKDQPLLFEDHVNKIGEKQIQSENQSLLPKSNKDNPLQVAENKPLFPMEQIQQPATLNSSVILKIKDNEPVTNNNQDDDTVNTVNTSVYSADTSENINSEINEAMVNNMDAIFMVAKNKDAKMTSEGLVECGIWDFAGQREYYATHQTFFTPHAIYLLVADINDGTPSLDYKKPVTFDAIGEYTDYWLDSIHCLCDVGQDRTANLLCPPVIMVCTGIDKVPDKEREATIAKYERDFLDTYGIQTKSGHTRGKIHFISNKSLANKDFDYLRKQISEIAQEMGYFAEHLPTRWIQLENLLMVLKDLKRRKQNEYLETFENIERLAKLMSFEKKELVLFLNYQHKIGNIIFFEDKWEYVILNPNWLIDCFRCLVCDDTKMEGFCSTRELYDLHNSGKLSEQLINKLFRKLPKLDFGEYKTYILDVMEKFDIILKSKYSDSYFMPCMITQSIDLREIKTKLDVENIQCTPWLVLDFKFLPIVFFNHVMFHYIKEKTVCKEKSQHGAGRPAIYAGKAVVYLDDTISRLLIICFSRNAISLQIWKWKEIGPTQYKNILQELCNKVEELEGKFIHKLEYEIKAKCSTGDFCSSSDRLSYHQLIRQCEGKTYWCKEHKTAHSREDLENTWLKHASRYEDL